VTGSNRLGSAAGDEADWDAQSFHSGGLESEAPHANLLDEPCESFVLTLMMCSFYGVPVTAIPSVVCFNTVNFGHLPLHAIFFLSTQEGNPL